MEIRTIKDKYYHYNATKIKDDNTLDGLNLWLKEFTLLMSAGTEWPKEQTFNRPDEGECEIRSTESLLVIIPLLNWNQTLPEPTRFPK